MEFNKSPVEVTAPGNGASFFLYIVESPSDRDFLDNRAEGRLLQSALSLAGVSSQLTLAVNEQCFREAISDSFRRIINQKFHAPTPQMPFLHISAHGNCDGLQFTDKSGMVWDDLACLLRPINAYLGGFLIVTVSSCEGFNACRMAMKTDNLPFFLMVGSTGQPRWSDTAIGFATFYHHWAKGRSIEEALNAMKVASGDNNFVCITGELAQKTFLDELNRQGRLPFPGTT